MPRNVPTPGRALRTVEPAALDKLPADRRAIIEALWRCADSGKRKRDAAERAA